MAANRAQDCLLLDRIKARASGMSLSEICKKLGGHTGKLTTQTNGVMDADIAYCREHQCDDIEEVKAAYWPRLTPTKRNEG